MSLNQHNRISVSAELTIRDFLKFLFPKLRVLRGSATTPALSATGEAWMRRMSLQSPAAKCFQRRS